MTPVVLDASAAVALLLAAGSPGDWVAGELSGRHVAAPELLMYETANVLRWHGASGAISPAEALLAHEDLCALGVELWPYSVVAARSGS